ncbi:MAG: hypothetical protein KTR26_18700 [Flammeovirgaceae bacterium]|nr:hypothetical protein [Flammeovirgaceae bacterium]
MKRISLQILTILFGIVSGCTAPDEASPFTAVDWENDLPKVEFSGEWYYFEKIGPIDKKEILAYCKQKYGAKWKKRFSEDLVEVLSGMGHTPDIDIQLTLRNGNEVKVLTGKFTEKNRRQVWHYNDEKRKEIELNALRSRKFSKDQVKNDISFLQKNIEEFYSYAELNNFNYPSAFERLIQKLGDTTSYVVMAIEIQKILSQFGDGHTRVSGVSRILDPGYLPFSVASYCNRVICIDQSENKLLNKDYPYLESINGVSTDSLLHEANKLVAKGSAQFKIYRSVARLVFIRYLLSQFNISIESTLQVVLSNDIGQLTELHLPVSNRRFKLSSRERSVSVPDNIGYLRIKQMSSSKKKLSEIEDKMDSFRFTDGLIIDIRDNPGGSRKILKFLAPYFIPDESKPIIVNAAVFRTNTKAKNNQGYLSNRSLYPFHSEKFNEQDRAAINKFSKNFKPAWDFPRENFSQWHYFLLGSEKKAAYKYDKPVVVLINANCYSAADVFAASFKELPNVTLIGTSTGGGSGRTKSYVLPNSGIKIGLSTMASFQPNGQLFDGNGVAPDIEVDETISDILRTEDSQLDMALELINETTLTNAKTP